MSFLGRGNFVYTGPEVRGEHKVNQDSQHCRMAEIHLVPCCIPAVRILSGT